MPTDLTKYINKVKAKKSTGAGTPRLDSFREAASDVLNDYRPTHSQVLCKVGFWRAVEASGIDLNLLGGGKVTPELIEQLTGISAIHEWWADPETGFRQYFMNQTEFAQRLAVLTLQGLDVLNEIAHDSGAPASSRVAALKLLMEMGERMPKQAPPTKYADEDISKLSLEELDSYIAKRTQALPTVHQLVPGTPQSVVPPPLSAEELEPVDE